ncbi:MAG: hypothetical protein U0176_22065 [Bacteroidia bacterium]
MPSQAPDQVAELFRVCLDPAHMQRFVEGSEEVHRFFSTLDGYCGMEVLILSDAEAHVILRWLDFFHFDRHLPLILNACPLRAWLQEAQSVTHRPAIIKHVSPLIPSSS